MIVLGLLVLAAVTLAPLAWSFLLRTQARGRREPALALHRAQLTELDRDLADGRIGREEYGSAVLEVQRRLLAAASVTEAQDAAGPRWPVFATLLAVPLAAAGFYAIGGHPELPAVPLADRLADADRAAAESAGLATRLRAKLATLDPNSDQAREGLVLLGNVEGTRGDLAAAVEAWRRAMTIRYDATLAVQVAEAQCEAEGRISAESAALFRRALETAPADAPWRKLAESRLAEAKTQSD